MRGGLGDQLFTVWYGSSLHLRVHSLADQTGRMSVLDLPGHVVMQPSSPRYQARRRSPNRKPARFQAGFFGGTDGTQQQQHLESFSAALA